MRTYLGFPEHAFTQPAYLTIGNFDGVHRGHQMLVGRMAAAAHAAGCQAGLVTFDPHPLAILRPEAPLLYLTTATERAELLAAVGLDFVLILPFSRDTAALSAAEFMRRLTRHVPVASLWVGADFALGHDREGDVTRLTELGAELGYALEVVPPFDTHGETVRSSRVRTLLAQEGAVSLAAELLGRPYQVWGTVVQGAQRGRQLGFPTANLSVSAGRLLPAFGVYACWAWREARGYQAVVNVGVRPSFPAATGLRDNAQPTVEAYLLDFDGNLYGERLGLSFVHRLRGEQRFAGMGELATQIGRDAQAARRILADPPDHASGAWQELVHTADWAIRVAAATQQELFATTARAMYALQDADLTQPITLARSISASADAPPELLVAWLNRLLFSQELGGEMYTRFEIHEISATGLCCTAYGYRGTPSHTAIKAVTYYDLDVRPEMTGGWTATVTFDV